MHPMEFYNCKYLPWPTRGQAFLEILPRKTFLIPFNSFILKPLFMFQANLFICMLYEQQSLTDKTRSNKLTQNNSYLGHLKCLYLHTLFSYKQDNSSLNAIS